MWQVKTGEEAEKEAAVVSLPHWERAREEEEAWGKQAPGLPPRQAWLQVAVLNGHRLAFKKCREQPHYATGAAAGGYMLRVVR